MEEKSIEIIKPSLNTKKIPEINLKILTTKSDHNDTIWSLSWSKDKKTIVTTSSDKKVNLYTFCPASYNLEFTESLPIDHKKTVRTLSFSPDNTLLACGSFDSTISIFLLNDNIYDCVSKIEGHESEVKTVEFHPEENLLVTCGRDKTIWIWEFNSDFEFFCKCIINAHDQDVKKVRWVPNKNLLVSCSYDEKVKVWKEDEEDEEEYFDMQVFKEHKGTVWDVCFSNDGERMFTCSEDKSIVYYKWKEEGFEVKQRLENVHFRDIYSIVYDNTLKVLFSASADNMIKCLFVDDNSMQLFYEIKAHDFDVNCLAIYEEARLLASVGDDKKLKIWQY